MIRLGSLLVFLASIGFSVTAAPYADDGQNGIVIAIDRSAGFTNPERARPMDHYRFTVAQDGSWDFKPLKGEPRKGELGAEGLSQWLEAIEDGLDTVVSNPMLGALDEPYLEIAVQTRDKKTRVRISVSEKLSQAIEKRIVELARPDE